MSPWYSRQITRLLLVVTTSLLYSDVVASGFSMQRNDNLAVYWGQDGAGGQKNLGSYCNDNTIDTIPLAFLFTFFGQGGEPVIDFANICGQGGNTFPGTALADCSFMASDIQKCQANGKLITLSLGGAVANVGFNSASQASGFAKTIWNMFLGGNGGIRPFGQAVLDGVDLDIENGSAAHYDTFVNSLRSLAQGNKKRFYITAAPQCPFPDAKVGEALSNAPFDAVYVQFYNNFCETSVPSEFNFATWDNWAKTQSPNKNVKVYLGAPASPQAAGSGYVSASNLISVAKDAQRRYSSFGGIMLWDADTAVANNNFHRTVKNGISNRAGAAPDPGNPAPLPTFVPPSNPNPNPPNPKPTSAAPTPKPKPSPTKSTATESTTTTSSLGDPRTSGRVQRPGLIVEERAADGITTHKRNSRFFRT